MKPSLLLPACVASTLAALDSRPNRIDLGPICATSLLQNSGLLSDSICSNESILSKYQGGSAFGQAGTPWTPSAPCFRNSTTGPEFCIYHSSAIGNGRGAIFLTDEKRAAHLAKSRTFKSPEMLEGWNQMNRKAKVVAIPGKEYGLVATEVIYRGEVILQETPTILIDYKAYEEVPRKQLLTLQSQGLDFLPFSHRSRFLNMSTHGEELGHLDKIEKILVTNSFDVDIEDGEEEGFYAVFAETARLNHDCRPNVDYYFDPETLTQKTTAVRDIQAGEELTVTYIYGMASRAERLEKLKRTWGFDCSCHTCAAPAPQTVASDERIEQIAALRSELKDYTTKSRATPQMADLLVSLYEQERLYSVLNEAYTLAALEWNGIGEPWTATKYARLAIEHGLAAAGGVDSDLAAMENLASDPWGHWSWMLRTKKRMGWGPRPVEEEDDDDDEDDEESE